MSLQDNKPIKYVTEFKNKHKGDDIYVICSGKSCDFIDETFFENKITIGVNQVYQKFKTDYLVRKENRHMFDVINQCPNTIHCITVGNCGANNEQNVESYAKSNIINDNIYFIKHLSHKPLIFSEDPDYIVISYSTVTTAIHLAAYMGAKNILLVGHDNASIDGEVNFSGYYDKFKRAQANEIGYKNWLNVITDHTLKVKNILKEKYGCNIYSINPFTNLRFDGHKIT